MTTDLSLQYERQARWRHWDEALACIPAHAGQRVLDLGCGVGDVTARFHERGARVIGVDADQALLDSARARHLHHRFEKLDITQLTSSTFGTVDGIWASFVAAYLPALDATLQRWRACIEPGGWLALIEIDDLLGHEPLPASLRTRVRAFYDSARADKRYDFECGSKLADAVERAGLTLLHVGTLPDDELSFHGVAPLDVMEAWRSRLQRMGGLKTFFGRDFPELERSFLAALAAPDHRATARVCIVVARVPTSEANAP